MKTQEALVSCCSVQYLTARTHSRTSRRFDRRSHSGVRHPPARAKCGPIRDGGNWTGVAKFHQPTNHKLLYPYNAFVATPILTDASIFIDGPFRLMLFPVHPGGIVQQCQIRTQRHPATLWPPEKSLCRDHSGLESSSLLSSTSDMR